MLHGSGLPYCALLLGVAQKNVLNNIWAAPVLVLYRIITECFFGYEIQAAATIGRRFTIHHGYAVVINKFVVAGDDFTIRHGVTIGNRGPDSWPARSSAITSSWAPTW